MTTPNNEARNVALTTEQIDSIREQFRQGDMPSRAMVQRITMLAASPATPENIGDSGKVSGGVVGQSEPIYQVRQKGSLKWQDMEPISLSMFADEELYQIRTVYAGPQPSQPAKSGEPVELTRKALAILIDEHKAHDGSVDSFELADSIIAASQSGRILTDVERFKVVFAMRVLQEIEAGRSVSVKKCSDALAGLNVLLAPQPSQPSAEARDDERIEFEAAWSKVYDTGDFLLRHHALTDQYANHDTQRAWEGWKLARAASPQPVAQTERALTFAPLYKKLMRGDVDVCEAYLGLKVVGSCPTQEEFCTALEALLATGDKN